MTWTDEGLRTKTSNMSWQTKLNLKIVFPVYSLCIEFCFIFSESDFLNLTNALCPYNRPYTVSFATTYIL